MENKLSGLSKPVAEIRKHYPLGIDAPASAFFQPLEGLSAVNFGDLLYSQEYVSALIKRAERLDSILTESVQALKAAQQREAELEAKLTLSSDVRKHYLAGYDDGHSRGLNAGRLYKADDGMIMHRHASANAYAVEGDK